MIHLSHTSVHVRAVVYSVVLPRHAGATPSREPIIVADENVLAVESF